MDRRKVALGLLIGGGLIAAFFMLLFDVRAPGTNIVNLGLMNDRTNGIIFGGLMAVVGVVLFSTAPAAPQRTVAFAQPAPIAPQGFWMDLQAALSYPTLSPSRSQTSLAAYRVQVRQANILVSDSQSAWAWSHGVPADQAAQFIGYVEAHRAWARGAGMKVSNPVSADPVFGSPGTTRSRATVGLIVAIALIYLAYVALPLFSGGGLLSKSKQIHEGQSRTQVIAALGEPDGSMSTNDGSGFSSYDVTESLSWRDEKYHLRVTFWRDRVRDVACIDKEAYDAQERANNAP